MDVLRQAGSVLLVFSLLGALLWALRRGGKISFQGLAWKRALGSTRTMVVVERLSLTPNHMLHIVRIDGRDLLVVTHPQGCSVLTAATEKAMGAGA